MNQTDIRRAIVADLAGLQGDPLGFVRYGFPWGEGELEGYDGPDEWQTELLASIRDKLITAEVAIQEAVASGHGVGKSALVAWIILWALSTMADARGVVTANTDTQLRTKTWPEVAKWHRLFIGSFMFELTATALYSSQPQHEKTWRVDIVPWSETNTEAFAGLHNKGKRVLLLFDEAAGIPPIIWETAEGALTDDDTEILWCVFGNPTRNTGRFAECFGRLRHRWATYQVDSRTARMSNKAQIQQWIEDYGEDSDFVRIRVRGVFPRAGTAQFIASDVIAAARKRELHADMRAPLIMAVDVARFGDDKSVIRFRRGRDARSIPPLSFRGLDTMQLAARVAEWADKAGPEVIFVDGNGVGGGVVDRLRQLRYRVIEVNAGTQARNENDYFNKGAEMWGSMRDWLKAGGCIDESVELEADLAGREYGFDVKNRIQLERKADMKKRGLASPDDGDALAMTFAEPIAMGALAGVQGVSAAVVEYDVFGG